MKKINIFLSTFVLLSLFLAACSGSSNNNGTTTPGAQGQNSATQSPGVLPNTGGTQSPSAQATMPSETQMPTTQATTPSTTQMPTTQATTPPANGTSSQMNPGRLSDELQFQVMDQNNQPIGKVTDMVLDLKNLKVEYVIVSLSQSSGSSGSSSTASGNEIAIPWSMLTMQTANSMNGQSSSSQSGSNQSGSTGSSGSQSGGSQSTGTQAANSQNAFIFNGDQQKLASAPQFKPDMLPQFGQPAGNWDSSIKSYWNGSQSGTSGNNSSGSNNGISQTPPVTGTITSTETTPATQQAGAMSLQGVILASKFVDLQVEAGNNQAANSAGQGSSTQQGSSNQQIGTVKDAIVDTNTGDLSYIVLTSDSIQELSGKLVPVPPQAFKLDAQNKALVMQVSSQDLQGAPAFEQGQFPQTTKSGWDAQIQTYWQSHMPAAQQPSTQP